VRRVQVLLVRRRLRARTALHASHVFSSTSYLRRIVNQRHIPDEAQVAIDGDRITIEWADA
jgi:hypothetical protein